MVFHLSEHFLENSAKLTDESGCFFLCSSRHVCTKKAYEDILPRGLLGSPLPMADGGAASTWRERVPPRPTRTLPSLSSGENWPGKKKDPNAPKRPPSAFFLFCPEHRPKIKSEHPGLSVGDTAKKLGEMWSEQSAKDKQRYEQKAAKLKEKYEKDIAAYRAKGKSEVGKKGPGRPTGSKKKNEPEDEEEEEEEEDEDDEEEDEDEE
ncbi:hypothetical protein ACRRTK_000140 [Alexandromys fortis]